MCVLLSVMAYFHRWTRIPIQTQTQIPVQCWYYGKGIKIWIWVSGNMFCIILCGHRVWNRNLSLNRNPSLAVEISYKKYILLCCKLTVSIQKIHRGEILKYFILINFNQLVNLIFQKSSGGSKGGAGTPPPVQILSISCSFWEILAKSYVGAPPGELVPPPLGNPLSATEKSRFLKTLEVSLNKIYLSLLSQF